MDVVSGLGIVGIACDSNGTRVFLQKKKEMNERRICLCEVLFRISNLNNILKKSL